MNNKKSILIVGDVHGDWAAFNSLLAQTSPDLVLQCGDFGYWPHMYHFFENKLNIPIYWCDGNHENHDILREESKRSSIVEVTKNCFYMSRGSTLTLPDGRNVLFMGGADSIDKDSRIPYREWWPQELITQRDVYNLPDIDIDIVISHTVPLEFDVGNFYGKENDPSRKALSTVLERYHPSLWYAGHWHIYKKGEFKNCKWTILNHSEYKSEWCEWLL